MPPTRRLTDLEGTVLGIIASRPACTPYQVRCEFTDSPSPYWSGSAGAIYPLLTRLEDAGLVSSRAHSTGARKSRLYRVTPSGRAALIRWVGPPVGEEIVAVPPDPLRTRIAFLSVLPAAVRRKFLAEIEAGMRAFLDRAERLERAERIGDAKTPGGGTFEWMGRGALAMQRTRLEWIRRVIAAEHAPRAKARRSPRSRRQ